MTKIPAFELGLLLLLIGLVGALGATLMQIWPLFLCGGGALFIYGLFTRRRGSR